MPSDITDGQPWKEHPETCFLEHISTNDAETLRVIGEIDMGNIAQLEKELASLLKSGRPVLIDMRDCQYIDSTALRALFYSSKLARNGFCIKVTQNSPAHRLFHITGLVDRLGVRIA